VVGAGGAGADVPAFNQQARNAAQGEIPGEPDPRNPPSNDQYLSFQNQPSQGEKTSPPKPI